MTYTITIIWTVIGGYDQYVCEFYNFLIKPLAYCELRFPLVTHDASPIRGRTLQALESALFSVV